MALRVGRPLGFLLVAALLESQARGETRYGIVFDAGSSGTRVHVNSYRSGPGAGDFELIEDLLLKAKPGLSSFADDSKAAASSLTGLLDFAKQKVPKSEHSRTPVFLMASAGLRAIKQEKAEAILDSVRDELWNSPFLFLREWAYIMSGREEGIFGWVTVNYLMGALNDTRKSTGVIDLGGGSVQLVYHMPAGAEGPEENTGKVVHGGQEHNLYIGSHSHGLDRAREIILDSRQLGKTTTADIDHPCLPINHRAELKARDGSVKTYRGTGFHLQCATLYREQFDKYKDYVSFGGTFQPELPAGIFGFSYLYDRTGAIGLLDSKAQTFGTQQMTIQEMEAAARELCDMDPVEAEKRFAETDDAHKWANFCGDATYLTVLLHHGFGIARDLKLTMGNKLKDVEIVWTLGALIAKTGSAMEADLEKAHLKATGQAKGSKKSHQLTRGDVHSWYTSTGNEEL